MTVSKRWSVDIYLDEHDEQRRTRAEARLHTNDSTRLIGSGLARRAPSDRDVPEIGDEIAVARALVDLGHELLRAAAADLEQITHRPITLA